MRHIVISIILVFIFLSSFGQTQQTLKNGFVAATDSGVWYLQDGFGEWVQLFPEDTPSSYTYQDSVSSISYSDKGGLVCNSYYKFGSNTYNITIPTLLYANKISNIVNLSGSTYITTDVENTQNSIINNFKRKSLIYYKRQETKTYNGFFFIKDVNGSMDIISTMYYHTYPDVDYFNDMDSDNDSIWCWVGTNNKLFKMVNNYSAETLTTNPILELHSRQTDSHKICYNPDDDEFIIVSDSGIVYSYDKTILTTIDTINNCDGIQDMSYGGGFFYVVSKEIGNDWRSIHISSDLKTWISVRIFSGINGDYVNTSCAYSNKLDKTLTINTTLIGSNLWYNVSYYDSSGDKTDGIYIPRRTTFDLDYINYTP